MSAALHDARRALDDLSDLTWSAWTAADLVDVSAMLTVIEQADNPSEGHSLEELQEDFASETYDLGRDCLLARHATGEVVAIARSVCNDADVAVRRALLMGAVHPDLRGRGIGRAVMAWQVEHARAWYREHHTPEQGPLRISVFADSRADGEHRLAQRFGMAQARFFAELTLHLPDEPIDVPKVSEIEVRPWADTTPEATLAVRNAAFRDHWGSVDRPLTGWVEQQQAASFRSDWSFVAVDRDTGEVVSFLMSCAYEQDWEPQGYTSGYIDLLGTLRDYRGRGLGTALIRRAMRAFQESGMDAAEIGVDAQSETGAFGLYTSLGFRQTSGSVQLMVEESLLV